LKILLLTVFLTGCASTHQINETPVEREWTLPTPNPWFWFDKDLK
jgi:hypothetical protein